MNSVKIPDKCLQCGQIYKKKDADLVSESENAFVFHLTCSTCKSSIMLNIAIGRDGILTVSALTDAGKEDLDKLRSGNAISANDVIEAYTTLHKRNS